MATYVYENLDKKIKTPEAYSTANRPTNMAVGYNCYDITLGKPIWWNGNVWKDAVGVTV